MQGTLEVFMETWSFEAHLFFFMQIQPSFYGDSKTHFTTVRTHHSWQQDILFVFAFSDL
jgi:hypothetical protein